MVIYWECWKVAPAPVLIFPLQADRTAKLRARKDCIKYSCLILNQGLSEKHIFKLIIFPGSEKVEDLLLFRHEKVQQI